MIQATDVIWHQGRFVPWDEATIHVLTNSVQFSTSCLEGIRFYKTDQGPAIFRLREHMERLLFSMETLMMRHDYGLDQLCDIAVETVKRNHVEEGYLRPFAYYGYGSMTLNPVDLPVEFSLATWPWGKYLPGDMVDIKVSRFIRLHPQSTVPEAKLTGHYINSVIASLELNGTHYQEMLLLDHEGNIAEGPGENFFIVKDGVIKTPERGSILVGITRDTVVNFARDHGYQVEETKISLEEAYAADEAFFSGTAVEIQPIRSIDDKSIGSGEIGPVSKWMQSSYHDLVRGKLPDYSHYLTLVD